MKTKTISVRCPEEVIQKIDKLCRRRRVDRSSYILQALKSMFTGLEEQSVSETPDSATCNSEH